jgi:sRNA-binding protein
MAALLPPNDCGELMPKPNYHQARKQKEVARKARQQEKQQRKAAAKVNPAGADGESATSPDPEGPRETSSESPT